MPYRIPIVAATLGRLRHTLRGRNAILHVFELWVGLAGIVSGIVFFYEPASINRDAISITVGHAAAEAWVLSYLVSGLLIWFGLLRPSPRWEVAALWLLGSATATEGIALIAVFGWHGVATAATLIALTVAAWLRALIVQADTLRLADVSAHGGVSGGGRR